MKEDYLLRLENVEYRNKRENQRVLSDISLGVRGGEVCGIIGVDQYKRNILSKILSGIIKADSGRFYFNGEQSTVSQAAVKLGQIARYCGATEQLLPALTISDSIVTFNSPSAKSFFVKDKHNKQIAAEYLKLAMIDASPADHLNQLTQEERQRLEIIRGIAGNAKILILDAPLGRSELISNENAFVTVLNHARERGIAIIMMFSNLDRMMNICDSSVVIRDGRTVKRYNKEEFDRDSFLKALVSPNVPLKPITRYKYMGDPHEVLLLKNICSSGIRAMNFNLSVHRGEIVGLVSANDEWNGNIQQLLMGLHPIESGTIYRGGIAVDRKYLSKICTRQNRSCFVEGLGGPSLHMNMSMEDNLIISSLDRLTCGPLGFIGKDAYRFAQKYSIKRGLAKNRKDVKILAESLSVDQRIQLLMEKIKVFNPDLCVFLGVMENTDFEQRQIFREKCISLAKQGTGVLFISTGYEELIPICDRLEIMKDGKNSLTLVREDFFNQDVTKIITGGL